MRSENAVSKTNSLKRKPDGGGIRPTGPTFQRSSLFRKSQELRKFPVPKTLPLPVDGLSLRVCCGRWSSAYLHYTIYFNVFRCAQYAAERSTSSY